MDDRSAFYMHYMAVTIRQYLKKNLQRDDGRRDNGGKYFHCLYKQSSIPVSVSCIKAYFSNLFKLRSLFLRTEQISLTGLFISKSLSLQVSSIFHECK